jgi:hypothetical protein
MNLFQSFAAFVALEMDQKVVKVDSDMAIQRSVDPRDQLV